MLADILLIIFKVALTIAIVGSAVFFIGAVWILI